LLSSTASFRWSDFNCPTIVVTEWLRKKEVQK
jgi:hypothetical protein